MPFLETWDPTQPTDGSFASEGDDELRRIKAALDERLSTLIDGWPNTDPLALISAMLDIEVLLVGTEATKPSPATSYLYYASDTKRLWIKSGADYLEFETEPADEGEVTPVGINFGQLHGKVYTHTVTLARTAEPDTTLHSTTFAIAGVASEKILILDAWIRGKRAAEPAFTTAWQRRGYYLHADDLGSAGGVDMPPGPPYVTAALAAIRTADVGGNAQITATIALADENSYNTADSYDIEIKVFVIALDDTVDLP